MEEKDYTELEEWLQQGKILLGSGQSEEAIRFFDKVLSKEPMQFDAYICRGIAKADGDDLENALSDFKKANMLNKKHPDPYFHMGNVAFMQGDFQKGVQNYNQAISSGYNEPDLYFHFGMVYEETEDFEAAIRHYTKAIHLDELNPVYRVRKVVCQIRTNHLNEAIETLDELHLIAPDSFEYYHMKSIVYVQIGQFDKADQILSEATALFPDDIDLLNDRIRLLVSKNDLGEALICLEHAKKVAVNDNDRKELLISEGRIYGGQEKYKEASECLNEALSLGDETPSHYEAAYLLVNISQMIKDYDEMLFAAEKLKEGADINAYSLAGWYYEALAHQLKGKAGWREMYEQAIRTYRRVAMDDPSRIDAYLYRAMCCKDIKNHQKALEMVDYIIALQPQNGMLHVVKAGIYEDMGQKAEAQKEQALAQSLGGLDMFSGMIGG